MINSLDELRKIAVKHILRRGPADYLLRHSLCKPWIASEHLNEMAWTDFRSLFFNFPKLRASLDKFTAGGLPLNPGDHVTAFLAAACHELLHVLWLHRHRSKGKEQAQWKSACEYAINFELVKVFDPSWIMHLGVMYPAQNLCLELERRNWLPTTDNFYELLCENPVFMNQIPDIIDCQFCERAAEKDKEEGEPDPTEAIRVLHGLPHDAAEREDILKYLDSNKVPAQKVPWEMLLLGGIEDAMTQEQSWTTPSRRNDLLPGWRHEKLLSFLWVLDVSPSIDDDMKRSFMATLQAGINLYHDAQHRVIFFADSIELDITISSGTNVGRIEVPEGNGTNLTDVWEVLERDLPEYALVLTDLELGEVPKPSYTKIVWGIVGDYRCFDPDYGIKIVLK